MIRAPGTPAASRPRALALGIEHPRGIAVVQSLGRRWIPVVGVERDPGARGLGSRYLQRVVMVPGDAAELDAAVSTLATLGALARGLRRR